MGLFTRLKNLFRRKRREQLRLGVAFGSGGAKGMAHLGILKAFEEEGIRFSYVTGTSIGSIVGALYAKGYTSADMVQVIENVNRKEFSKNLRPFADMAFVEQILSPYLDGNISSLPMPYATWATDAVTNEGRLIDSGNIARSVTASSAIPPFFKSVEIDGRRYYDGAFSNAIPADVCKNLGAEFVVGIDLSAFNKPDEEKGRVARIFGTVAAKLNPIKYKKDSKSRGYESADFMLRPMLRDHAATDISRAAMSRMYDLGYEEAKKHMGELKAAINAAQEKKNAR